MQIINSFQDRLKKAMDFRNIKQVDLVNNTGLDKTLINKYLAGATNASQRKLTLLADALNVNEIWLMGYDVPMARELKFDTINVKEEIINFYGLNSIHLLDDYNKLNDIGKQKANENVSDLTKIDEYTEKKQDYKIQG